MIILKRYYKQIAIVVILAIAIVLLVVSMSSPTEANSNNQVPTPVPPTATATPTQVVKADRVLALGGNTILDYSQPVLSTKYVDAKNNRGYADAAQVRIKEIGLEQNTNILVWRIRLEESGIVVEDRYASAREAEQYKEYTASLQKVEAIDSLEDKAGRFQTLTAKEKDDLLKEMLDQIIELRGNS